ncbi:hypothetical protein DXB01_04690 [Clostridium sp. OF10-22XD]|jgi:phage terminase small subunit|nr:hypothetical protein DXB01_04690 [Clostridium sp. OF10-22XD]DAO29523.1 MAG TPA: Terminase small subunit [Caudoviricetes sp.]
MTEPKLKPQLKLLVLNYLGTCEGNVKKSAISAGYSKSYAEKQAYKLLAREDVKEYMRYVQELNEIDKSIMSVKEVQKFWSDMIRNPAALNRDKLRASELLAKAQGQFEEW